jgi:hypothetical protein
MDTQATDAPVVRTGVGNLRSAVRALFLMGFATVLVATGVPAASSQETARVLGRVVDADTGRGLVGAGVQVQGTRLGTLSDWTEVTRSTAFRGAAWCLRPPSLATRRRRSPV